MNRPSKLAITLTAAFFVALSAQANSYTIGDTHDVSATGASPAKVVQISTLSGRFFAGVIHLNIDTIKNVDAFCIDPFQLASGTPSKYEVKSLSTALAGDYDGVSKSGLISKLWALNYSAAKSDTTGEKAAGLQIAIWMITGGPGFTVTSGNYWGASGLIAAAKSSNAAGANLVALTSSEKQDFVVRQVPDGGATFILLGLGLTGLAFMRRRI
jgi:hypothetical protein